MNRHIRNALILTLAIKLLFLAYGNILRPPSNASDIFEVFMENDSYWYLNIVENGYPSSEPQTHEQSAFAFFPLYPLLIAAFKVVFIHFGLSAFILSLALSCFWVWGIFQYMADLGFSKQKAFWLVAFLQVFPFHYFFHVFYTELLFSTILIWLMIFSRQRQFIGILFLSFALVLSRPTGLLFAFTIALSGLLQINIKQWLSSQLSYLGFIGAPIGIAAYSYFCYNRCGNPFIFSQNMNAWGRQYTWPWEPFFTPHVDLQILIPYVIFLIAIGLIAAALNKGKQAIIIIPNLVMPLFTGSIISYYRYVAVIHPIFQKLIGRFTWLCRPWVLVILFLFNLGTFTYWVLVHGVLSY